MDVCKRCPGHVQAGIPVLLSEPCPDCNTRVGFSDSRRSDVRADTTFEGALVPVPQ